MPEIFKRNIIKLLRHPDYTPLKTAHLAKALGVSKEDEPQFKAAVEELHQAGHIVVGAGETISLPRMAGKITGIFRANPKGFGFVVAPNPMDGDLFIPPGETADAMTGDTVTAKVIRPSKGGSQRCVGRIIEILKRAENRFVGTLLKQGASWFVQPDGSTFVKPIAVDDVTAKNAQLKDKVVVEIISYPTEYEFARGVIIEVFGKSGRYDSEIRSIIYQYHLPGEFNENCLRQSHDAAAGFNPQDIPDREDITGKIIVTIDPPDAKDFDDAISLEKDSNGNWVLGVHIADVSNFISLGSLLDVEANARGNSVYLPNKTIPMLPEILSNGICSLQAGQKRFVKSAYITYDHDGGILSKRFANSMMCSTQRLTYEQVDKLLKGHTKGIAAPVMGLLKDMESLSRAIENRRNEAGMLHLDLPETELIFDKAGRVVDACPADTSYPHTMIEMFMVEANEAVAALLDKLNVPFMRRIHPEPNILSMKKLSLLARGFGFTTPRTPDRFSVQKLLEAAKGQDCSLALNLIVLRSFEKAQYSPLNIGHYALASTHYCHFTSPIRRYADLLIHRLLDEYLRKGSKHVSGEKLSKEDLVEIGRHLTYTEEQADDAETELKKVLILQMLSSHIGDELDCVVTGLTSFGVFVQSKKFGIDGLIPMENLGPDKWQFNAKANCIVGLGSGITVYLGRAIKVRIISVNVPARQLNLFPVEPLAAGKKKSKPHKARNKSQRYSRKTRFKRRRRR